MYNHETVTEATIDGKKREVRIVQIKYNCLVPLIERVRNESLSLKKESCESDIMLKEDNRTIALSINGDISGEKLISMLDYFVASYSILKNKDEKSLTDIFVSFNKKHEYFSSENEDCISIGMGKYALVYIDAKDSKKGLRTIAPAFIMMMEKFYKN